MSDNNTDGVAASPAPPLPSGGSPDAVATAGASSPPPPENPPAAAHVDPSPSTEQNNNSNINSDNTETEKPKPQSEKPSSSSSLASALAAVTAKPTATPTATTSSPEEQQQEQHVSPPHPHNHLVKRPPAINTNTSPTTDKRINNSSVAAAPPVSRPHGGGGGGGGGGAPPVKHPPGTRSTQQHEHNNKSGSNDAPAAAVAAVAATATSSSAMQHRQPPLQHPPQPRGKAAAPSQPPQRAPGGVAGSGGRTHSHPPPAAAAGQNSNKIRSASRVTGGRVGFAQAADAGGLGGGDDDGGDDNGNNSSDDEEAPLAFKDRAMAFLIDESWSDGTLMGLKDDLFAGITLTMTQVPPAVAFSLIAHVEPLTGLYASFFIGIIMSIAGGRPGSISAAAGALAVVYPEIVDHYGEEALFMASIVGGLLYTIPGLLGVAKYVRLLPAPVMIGFVNGLAVVLARGQIPAFKDPQGEYIKGRVAGLTFLLLLITFAIMMLLPRYTKVVPSTFVAIVVGTALEHIFQMGTVTVGDLYDVSGDFPSPRAPAVDWDEPGVGGAIVSMGFIIAIIGLVESLLTVHVMNVMTETKGNFERESIAMGCANVVCGLFRTYAGCAVIGPSILNFHSGGGRRRVSAFITGLMMIIVVLGLYKLINWLPMGALSAVLFGIVVKTFDWRTFEMIFMMKVPVADSVIILVVTVVTVFADLAIAVGCGVGVALIFFAWDIFTARLDVSHVERESDSSILTAASPTSCAASTTANKKDDSGAKKSSSSSSSLVPAEATIIHLSGTLFFMSASKVFNKIEALHHKNEDAGSDVVLDFGTGECTVHDFSVVDSLNEIGSIYTRHGRRLHLRNLDAASNVVIERAAPFTPEIHNDTPGFFDDKCTLTIPKKEEKKGKTKQQESSAAEKTKNDEPLPDGDVTVVHDAHHHHHHHHGDDEGEDQEEEEEEREPTAREFLESAVITVFVYSSKLGINIPLKPFQLKDLHHHSYSSSPPSSSKKQQRVRFPQGFDLPKRFQNVSFAGRPLSEEQQKEVTSELRAYKLPFVW